MGKPLSPELEARKVVLLATLQATEDEALIAEVEPVLHPAGNERIPSIF